MSRWSERTCQPGQESDCPLDTALGRKGQVSNCPRTLENRSQSSWKCNADITDANKVKAPQKVHNNGSNERQPKLGQWGEGKIIRHMWSVDTPQWKSEQPSTVYLYRNKYWRKEETIRLPPERKEERATSQNNRRRQGSEQESMGNCEGGLSRKPMGPNFNDSDV